MVAHGIAIELYEKYEHYGILKETLEYLFLEILAKKFPKAVILPTLGNNDCKYHYVAPQNKYSAPDYYPFMYDLIFHRIEQNRRIDHSKIKDSFEMFGGFSWDYSENLTFVSFNSLYYNDRTPSNDTVIKRRQFEWFENLLDQAPPTRKFVIMFHIYPGAYFIGHVRFHWEKDGVVRFNSVINRNIEKISLILGAHSHFPDIKVGFEREFSITKLLNTKETVLENIPKWAMLIAPAVSSVFKNNPGFSLLTLEDQVPKNISWHFLELYKLPTNESNAKFNTLHFEKHMNITEFKPEPVLKFIKTLIEDKHILYRYLAHKIGFRGKATPAALAEYEYLGMLNLKDDFAFY